MNPTPETRFTQRKLITATAFALLAVVQVGMALQNWPGLGGDYGYFLPRLLDVQLHYAANGPSIQWWTPSFGGGLPAFANPQHTQFMPAQWIAIWLGPAQGAIVSSVMLIAFGGLLTYSTCLRFLDCEWPVALVAGLAFAASGYCIQRLLIGHLSFTTFPLVALLPFLICSGTARSTAAGIFGLFWAFLAFTGGYAICVTAALSVFLLAAVLSIARPDRFSCAEAISRLAIGIALGVATAAVKLVAIACWLGQLPGHAFIFPSGSIGLELYKIFQRFGGWEWSAALLLQQPHATSGQQLLFGESNFWEEDHALVFPIWVALFLAVPLVVRRLRASQWANIVTLFASLWLILEFSLARGPLWSVVKQLPLISSLHVNQRFNAALVLPLVLVAASSASHYLRRRPRAIVMLICFGSTAFIFADEILRSAMTRGGKYAEFNAAEIQDDWVQLRDSHELFRPITQIVRSFDDQTFALRASNSTPYEPVFGYGLPGPHFNSPIELGPIWRAPLNLHYPPYFLGSASKFSQFSTPPAGERANMELFMQRRQPDWSLPMVIKWAALVSLLGLTACLFLVSASVIRAFGEFRTR